MDAESGDALLAAKMHGHNPKTLDSVSQVTSHAGQK
jgi:hypothetical protein